MGIKNLSNNQTVAAIVGVVLTASITWIIAKRSPVGKIEQVISSASDLLNLSASEQSKPKILFNQKTVSDLSRVDVLFYNRTGNIYKEVNFTFKINANQGEKPILLGKSFTGPQKFASNTSIHLIKETSGEINYKVDILNPSDDPTKYFTASFIFLGKTPPKIDVSATGEGMELSDFEPYKITNTITIRVLVLLLIYSLLSGLVVLLLRWCDNYLRESERIRSLEIFKKTLDQVDLNELSSNTALQSEIVNAILKSKMPNSLNE